MKHTVLIDPKWPEVFQDPSFWGRIDVALEIAGVVAIKGPRHPSIPEKISPIGKAIENRYAPTSLNHPHRND